MQKGSIVSKQELFDWLQRLTDSFTVIAPVLQKKGQTIFQQIQRPKDIQIDYCSTMLSPRKYIYPSRQMLFNIERKKNSIHIPHIPEQLPHLIFGIHPCDMHAISVLDRTFLDDFKDPYYQTARKTTFTIVLNCTKSCDKGFCHSMKTGPFLQLKTGYDMVLTPLKTDSYLLESASERALKLIKKIQSFTTAKQTDFTNKKNIEKNAIASFTKNIPIKGLPALLSQNIDHPVYKKTADERCLGCTNCTMVCPTCYCYTVEDATEFNLKTTKRSRHWDSCQELNFAKVHGNNFRSSREARLRQFVMHKLCTWVEQYGCFGCVGCGRCMTWCPTGIDLTDIAKEIQNTTINSKPGQSNDLQQTIDKKKTKR